MFFFSSLAPHPHCTNFSSFFSINTEVDICSISSCWADGGGGCNYYSCFYFFFYF
jgi:hypothetical protein